MAYYKRLRDLREDNNYTQKEIAKKLYTTQPQYYRYESGMRDLPCELVIILAKTYNVSIDFDTGIITNNTKNESYQAEPFPDFVKKIIEADGLMNSIRKQ